MKTAMCSVSENPKSSSGFTLIELLVVMAIISILASMLLPSLGKAKEKARAIQCVSNLKQLGFAMQMYGDDNEDRLPLANGALAWDSSNRVPWTRPLLPYYATTNILTCPALSRKYHQSGFNYFMGNRAAYIEAGFRPAAVNLRAMQLPTQYILSGDANYPFESWDANPENSRTNTLFDVRFTPPPIHNQRVNVLFADFHVAGYRKFNAGEMTYSYYIPGVQF